MTEASAVTPAAAPAIRARVIEPEPLPLDHEERRAEERAARFERPPQNGEYQGPTAVRVLPAGFSGEDLRAQLELRLIPGAIWVRGQQRVRVVRATPSIVEFLELNFGRKKRSQSRTTFLNQGRPER